MHVPILETSSPGGLGPGPICPGPLPSQPWESSPAFYPGGGKMAQTF